MIRSVRLKNFKSFRDACVNLGLRNFLVGPNMAGKTNFIEVFRFLQRAAFPAPGTHGLPNAFPGGFAEFTWKGGDSNLMVIALEGESPDLPNEKWTYQIDVVGDERGWVRVQDERLSLSRPTGAHELIVTKDGLRSIGNIDGGEIFRGVDANRAAFEFELPGWDGSFLRKAIASWRFYRLIPALMKQPNTAAAPPFLLGGGENLAAWLMNLQTRYSEAFARIKQVCRDVLPGVEDLFTWPTQQATVMVASKERHLKRPLSAWDMSDGQLVFVALLSLIFGPPETAASLCCVEEVENHLHPKLIETLMELWRQVQDEFDPSTSTQIIATTHSPYVVDKVPLDDLIVFEKRSGATSVTYPRDKAHLRELLENEELGLGDLYYSGALQGA